MLKDAFSKVTVPNVMVGVVAGASLAVVLYLARRIPTNPASAVIDKAVAVVAGDAQ